MLPSAYNYIIHRVTCLRFILYFTFNVGWVHFSALSKPSSYRGEEEVSVLLT